VLERRDKMGFETPTDAGCASATRARRAPAARPGPLHEWLDPVVLERELDDFLGGRRAIGLQVWRWLSLESWARRFVANDARVHAARRRLDALGAHASDVEADGVAQSGDGRASALVDLVVLSEVRWGYFRTRKQFLLSRFPSAGGCSSRSRRRSAATIRGRRGARERHLLHGAVPEARHHERALQPRSTGAPGAARERAGGAAARARLRARVEPEPVLLVSNIYAAGALSRLPRKLLFYDFNDSPFQFAGVPRGPGLLAANARTRWMPSSWSPSTTAAAGGRDRRPRDQLGNGVELAHFATPRRSRAELASLPRPLIGYVGLLSHFLDFEALEALRQARRGGTLVLIGPGSPPPTRRSRARGRARGSRCWAQALREMPAWMQALDVGVIPFRANDPYVQGINPNKVYQYLAAGVPVVTTPVLDLEPRPPQLAVRVRPAPRRAAVRRARRRARRARRAGRWRAPTTGACWRRAWWTKSRLGSRRFREPRTELSDDPNEWLRRRASRRETPRTTAKLRPLSTGWAAALIALLVVVFFHEVALQGQNLPVAGRPGARGLCAHRRAVALPRPRLPAVEPVRVPRHAVVRERHVQPADLPARLAAGADREGDPAARHDVDAALLLPGRARALPARAGVGGAPRGCAARAAAFVFAPTWWRWVRTATAASW
jgi:glycosyltransferase involved in cell wall biosynthesis